MALEPRPRRIASDLALRALLLLAAWASPVGDARAQIDCAAVLHGLEPPGSDGTVHAFCTLDLGTGPALYAGGSFRIVGDAVASSIARFDGVRWSALGAGIGSTGALSAAPSVDDLVAFDFGAGPRLVASGMFDLAGGQPVQNVAAWDGASWTAVGLLPAPVLALVVFDDGGGPRLIASTPTGVVRWNGGAWDVLPHPGGNVADFEVHDDGGGPALYACGSSFGAGVSVVRWTGASWTAVGVGPSNGVSTLASHDDGSGRKLYAARSSTTAPTIFRWSGTSWDPVGSLFSPARALEVLDLHDGAGPRLFAALLVIGAPARVVRWNGTNWSDVASGALLDPHALTVFGVGTNRRLFAGASISDASTCAGFGLARVESSAWIAAHPGRGLAHRIPNPAATFSVNAFAQHDFGAGPEVLVGGDLLSGPPTLVSRPIARWNGSGWSEPGAAPIPGASVVTLESFVLGGTRELFAGLDSSGIWRWNGAAWASLPSAPFHTVRDFQVFTAQGQQRLAAAGNSVQFPGTSYALVRTWDGSMWTTIASQTNVSVANALAVFDDGSGPALYCGGRFLDLGGVAGTNGIARWNGLAWSSVGGGLTSGGSTIETLTVFDDGSGPALYAGGRFSSIGGASIADIARWNGSTWAPVGASGTSGSTRGVIALAAHDGGSGPKLWAGGDFSAIGGVTAGRLARWDGTTWTPAAGAADGAVTALKSIDERTGGARTLWIAGEFTSIGGVASSHLARFGCAIDPGFPFCFGDLEHGPSACPCANSGAPGHGCATVAAPSGAILGATGSTAPAVPGGVETLTLNASNLPATTTAVFAQGASRTAPTPFGEGVLCLGAPLVRLATKSASGGIASYPEAGDVPLSVRGGTPFGSGVTRWYQVWFRASATFCGAGNYGVSSGREITW